MKDYKCRVGIVINMLYNLIFYFITIQKETIEIKPKSKIKVSESVKQSILCYPRAIHLQIILQDSAPCTLRSLDRRNRTNIDQLWFDGYNQQQGQRS